MKARFFLSSSSERLDVAKALEANLVEEGFEPTLWKREVHAPGQYNLEALLRHAESSDFAVFVFAPDDQAIVGGAAVSAVRDNVLFESGLFMGALGRDRCFIVQDAEQSMHMPSDLAGLTTLKYNPRRSDGNLSRSLGPATSSIAGVARATASAAATEFTANELKLLRSCKDPSMPSNQAFKAFGSKPVDWDDKLCMRFVHLLEHGLIRQIGATEIETTRRGLLLSEAE